MIKTIILTTLAIITPISIALNVIYAYPVLSAAAREVRVSYAPATGINNTVQSAYLGDALPEVRPIEGGF